MAKNDDDERKNLASIAGELDLEKYDVRGIAGDLAEVANLPKAVAATAGRAALVPLAAAIVTWIIFGARMGWTLLPFAFVAAVLSLAIAAVLAVAIFTRRQVDKVNDASHSVLGVVSEMHGDLVSLRAGDAELTVRGTATTLATGVVFPMLEEMGVEAASTVMRGPLAPVARKVIGVPLGVVEKAVAAGIQALPLAALDAAIDLSGDQAAAGKGAGLVDRAMGELADRYQSVESSLEGLVRKIMNRSLMPFVASMIVAAIPLLLWWIFGWAVT